MTSKLVELFGDSYKCKITDLFIRNPDEEFLLHQVMIHAEVALRVSAERHITKLLHNNIVMQRPYVEFNENVLIYRLNKDNAIVKMLIAINE
jgi:hypothetical protein